MSLTRLLLGRRLSNSEAHERKIGSFEGVPAMGLDGLGSSAYGPEAALTVLAPLGAASLGYVGPVMLAIIIVLGILYVSYRQTIRAYPSSGGAYTVARENLGTRASLLAASALMIDYVLNVAVGISAGVAALVSMIPPLHAYIPELCLAILVFVTLINLRGTLDAGRLFALPTYAFVASFSIVLAIGISKAVAAGGQPEPVIAPPPLPAGVETLTLWLLLRSFSNGCTAMTGVEAVSNGVSAFRDPTVKYALRTLTVIVVVLVALLGGVAYLAKAYGVGAMDQTQDGYQSVLSQLTAAVVGRNAFYYVSMGSLLCVLALSANTSFTDFPRLCRVVAQDGFLPRPFAVIGRRLVFSVGILYLAVTAGALLVVFGGITDRLIPLFAIGALLTFTISQAGMVAHWKRRLREGDGRDAAVCRRRLVINATGALATGIAAIIVIAAKFGEGAWITLLAIPATIMLLCTIRGYYKAADEQLRNPGPLELRYTQPPIVLVAAEDWSRLTDKALSFALTISQTVYGVHLRTVSGPAEDNAEENALREQWRTDVEGPARAAGLEPPKLVTLESKYRRFEEPLLGLVRELQKEACERPVAVLLPTLIKQRWWAYLLHTHRARRMRNALLACGGPNLVVMSVPWHLTPREPIVVEDAELKPEVERARQEGAVIVDELRSAAAK